jgi:hypothetical protein
VPFYLFSQRELAPAEDQGVVFGIVGLAFILENLRPRVRAVPDQQATRRPKPPRRRSA